MPSILTVGSYRIIFYARDAGEPVHFHIVLGDGTECAKIWILSNYDYKVARKTKAISKKDLNALLRSINSQAHYIVCQWGMLFGYVTYYQ